MIRKKFKLFSATVLLLSVVVLPSDAFAQERHVRSSCHLQTTAKEVERGKCTIKTYIDGDYIMLEIQEAWNDTPNPGKPSLMRLVNKPSCTFWSYTREDGCKGEFWYGDEWGILVGAGEVEEHGVKVFGYSLGRGYNFGYDGPLPRP